MKKLYTKKSTAKSPHIQQTRLMVKYLFFSGFFLIQNETKMPSPTTPIQYCTEGPSQY